MGYQPMFFDSIHGLVAHATKIRISTATNHMLKTILKPLASLRLTVVLLAASMLLVFAGTMAQVTLSNYDAQEQYFHSFWVWISFSTLLDRPFAGRFPFPGGFVIGALLLVNLLAAHSVRFKLSWKRSGIILTHLGIILLLVGEGLSSRLKVESHMNIEEGSSASYTYDTREVELAIVDPSPADHDNVTVIPVNRLKQGGAVSTASLPFKVRIDAFYVNSDVMSVKNVGDGPKATAGTASEVGIGARAVPQFAGTGESASRVDIPAIYVTPLVNDKPVGTFMSTLITLRDDLTQVNQPQEFEVDGKPYTLQLRFKRYYKPYTVHLNKFRFDRYTGTQVAKNFSSDIRFVDPTSKEDRLVHISMNHPLRYQGETFFQAGWDEDTEHGTILQVVKNPGWTLPYISCAIGGLGLLIHFGITLVNFLKRQLASNAKSAVAYTPGVAIGKSKGSKGGTAKPQAEAVMPSPWMDWGIPMGVAFITIVYLISQTFTPAQKGPFDLLGFSQLPVSRDGRIQPLDTTARVALRSLRGKDHVTVEEKDDKGEVQKREMSAAEWMADVMARPEKAADYKVFRIDWPDLVGRLTKVPGEKYFSPNEVLAHWNEFAPQIINASEAKREKTNTPYQTQLLALFEKLQLYLQLGGAQTASAYRAFRIEEPELRQALGLPAGQSIFSLDELDRSRQFQMLEEIAQTMVKRPPGDRSANEQKVLDFYGATMLYRRIAPVQSLFLVPPQSAATDWQSLETTVAVSEKAGQKMPAEVTAYQTIEGAYADRQPEQFNHSVAMLHGRVDQLAPTEVAKARFETLFNAFDPFYKCMIFYVAAFLLVCFSWLGWSRPLYRTAAVLLVMALIVHTGGLIARIYISGRPPVTNLASSAIFIAWGVVGLSLGFELVFRNTIGFVTATVAGFSSLLIADRLALRDGDTMKVLQAVLDTNFWLATHVVCVTLGYAATFLTGLLGIIYIVWGLFTKSMKKEDAKELARMTYGVACFAIFFSFVGTILGGIWADQSWGRFWGWDSKENGAVLVVLTNAVLLHARWGGLVRERGIAVLAVFGNIIVAWSWFGTNQLGVGLHAYGFTNGVSETIWAFVGSQVLIMGLGLIPVKLWASTQVPAVPVRRNAKVPQPVG